MQEWYIRKMIEAYQDSRFEDAMNYAKMAGVDPGDIASMAEPKD